MYLPRPIRTFLGYHPSPVCEYSKFSSAGYSHPTPSTSLAFLVWLLGEQGRGLPLLQGVGDRRDEASTLNYIGLMWSDLGEKQKALGYYEQALPLSRVIHNHRGKANILAYIGLVRSHLGKQQKAVYYIEQAIEIMEHNNLSHDRGRLTLDDHKSFLENLKNDQATEGNTIMQIFISYPHKDAENVLKLKGTLSRQEILFGLTMNSSRDKHGAINWKHKSKARMSLRWRSRRIGLTHLPVSRNLLQPSKMVGRSFWSC
jgi:tetratricopeptide (TPR) repeat protein